MPLRPRSGLVACLVSALAATMAMAPAVAPASAAPAKTATTVSDPAQYVNAYVGSKPGATDFGNGGGAGNTFPGADAPFGMLQWSPDTVTYQHGGYSYDDNRIRGFSLTHISGAGCGDYGNIPFMPTLGTGLVSSYTFSHANEKIAPGAYGVTFDNGLKTELAVSKRAGVARFTYPGTDTASLLIDVAKAFNNAMGAYTIGTNSITGYEDGGGFCGAGNKYRVYFTATFDHTITGVDKPTQTQPILHFDTSSGRTVTARVGISFVSIANAQTNLSTEQGSKTFEQVRDGTRADWNALLGRISVAGGTAAQTTTFYTALYHSLLFPETFSDVNGQYIGFDKAIHTTASGHTEYATFSGWDVYRSQVQLIAFLDPGIASDIGQTIDDQAAQAGYLDRWTLANGGTGVMNGDPLPTIAANMYAFGGTGFNASDLLGKAVAGTANGSQRPGYAQYNAQGYIPEGVTASGARRPAAWNTTQATSRFPSSPAGWATPRWPTTTCCARRAGETCCMTTTSNRATATVAGFPSTPAPARRTWRATALSTPGWSRSTTRDFSPVWAETRPCCPGWTASSRTSTRDRTSRTRTWAMSRPRKRRGPTPSRVRRTRRRTWSGAR